MLECRFSCLGPSNGLFVALWRGVGDEVHLSVAYNIEPNVTKDKIRPIGTIQIA